MGATTSQGAPTSAVAAAPAARSTLVSSHSYNVLSSTSAGSRLEGAAATPSPPPEDRTVRRASTDGDIAGTLAQSSEEGGAGTAPSEAAAGHGIGTPQRPFPTTGQEGMLPPTGRPSPAGVAGGIGEGRLGGAGGLSSSSSTAASLSHIRSAFPFQSIRDGQGAGADSSQDGTRSGLVKQFSSPEFLRWVHTRSACYLTFA